MASVEHFLLIENDPHAQRLVIAWPHVGAVADEEKRFERWAALAMVPIDACYRVASTLFEFELCREDGTSDSQIIGLIRAQMIARIAPRQPRPTPAPTPTRP